ncbi:AP-1 complex-associated regulatory protein-like isoform X1 [Paramormyrops kingsleyae]|uniref:Adaptor related protein complex 1 associated regulatory protein n=1 Tax=Paramormyrops kingsleyae TaxID=1676925 RepID=A0A3B3QQ37_9TELE|nr:AP-1 complex-associated regulatory protein-like isoform X2 [Paramormyrops kingsleyae]
MGNCWTECCGIFRREASRIHRGGGSKYFRSSTTGEHYTIEFENLVESDEAESPRGTQRPINEDEITYLRENRYAAITDKQLLIDGKLQAELAAQEEQLRVEEETEYAAQRQAARAAQKRNCVQLVRDKADTESHGEHHKMTAGMGDGETCPRNTKAPLEQFRSSRVSSETNAVTPNTESSYDFTTRTRSTNDDGTSLDLEWEDEEGMVRGLVVCERSRTEEDILRAALLPGRGQAASGPASASEDSNTLEWENDFVRTHAEDTGDSESNGFSTMLLETPPGNPDNTSVSDSQDR